MSCFGSSIGDQSAHEGRIPHSGGRGAVQQATGGYSREMAVARLAQVPWDALRADIALPAIGRVLQGTPAEREVDKTLRAHRELSRDERAAVVEAIFGVALWRRRLAYHAGIIEERSLLACLLRDLAGHPLQPQLLAPRLVRAAG